MPKMKTNAAAKKRFTFTGTGKIKRKHAYHSHILTKKTTKQKRNLCYSHPDQKDDEAEAEPLLFGYRICGRRGQNQKPAREIIIPGSRKHPLRISRSSEDFSAAEHGMQMPTMSSTGPSDGNLRRQISFIAPNSQTGMNQPQRIRENRIAGNPTKTLHLCHVQ